MTPSHAVSTVGAACADAASHKRPMLFASSTFFPIPQAKRFTPIGKEVSGAFPVLQLVRYRLVADDGARDELGEQGHIRAEIDDILLRFRLAPVETSRV